MRSGWQLLPGHRAEELGTPPGQTQVECKVAEAIFPRHYQHGFHSTATCGAIAMNLDTGELWAQQGFIHNVAAERWQL